MAHWLVTLVNKRANNAHAMVSRRRPLRNAKPTQCGTKG